MMRLKILGLFLGMIVGGAACGVQPLAEPVAPAPDSKVGQVQEISQDESRNQEVDSNTPDELTTTDATTNETVKVEVEPVTETEVVLEANVEKIPPNAGPTAAQRELLANLKPLRASPAINNGTWLNTEPLAWDDLRGKVVIVEFWTYG